MHSIAAYRMIRNPVKPGNTMEPLLRLEPISWTKNSVKLGKRNMCSDWRMGLTTRLSGYWVGFRWNQSHQFPIFLVLLSASYLIFFWLFFFSNFRILSGGVLGSDVFIFHFVVKKCFFKKHFLAQAFFFPWVSAEYRLSIFCGDFECFTPPPLSRCDGNKWRRFIFKKLNEIKDFSFVPLDLFIIWRLTK